MKTKPTYQELEKKLIQLQNIAKIGLYNLDLNTNLFSSTPAFDSIIGISEKDIKSHEYFRSILHPEDLALNDKLFSDSIKMKQDYSSEYRILINNKKELKWINEQGRVIYKKGEPISFIGTIQDITKQKISEQELKKTKEEIDKSEKKFRELYEKSGDAILIIENGVFVECNQAAVDMLKYKTKSDFLSSHPSKLSPKFQPDGINSYKKSQEMMRIALEKGTHRFEWMHTRRDGETFPVEVLLTAIENKPNSKTIHCVWRDITERKESEADLVKLNTAISNSINEVYIFDSINLKFSFANKGAINNLGYTLEELKLLSPFDIKPELTHDNFIEIIAPMVNGEINKLQFETIHQRKNRTTYPVEVNLSKFIINDNSYLLAIIIDITERKKSEQALKNSENALKIAQNIAQLGSYNLNLKDFSFTSSSIFDSIVGLNMKDIKTLDTWHNIFVHPDDLLENKKMFEDCIKTGNKYDREYRIITKNTKELKWLHGLGEIIYKDDKPTHFTGTIQEITQRKLIEEKIKQSDAILNQISSIVKVVDKKGNIIYASPSMKTILGYDPQDMLGQGWWINTSPDRKKANEVRDDILNMVHNNVLLKEELTYRKIITKNGKEKLFQWVNSKGLDDSIIFIGIDVTEKHEKEMQFKTLTETAQDAIIISSHERKVIEWNKAAEQMFGYSKEEILNKPITLLIPKMRIKQHKEKINKVIEHDLDRNKKDIILNGISKNGQTFPIEISQNSWKNKGNYVYCTFVRDITGRHHEEQIKEIIYSINKYAQKTVKLDKLLPFIKKSLNSVINTSNFFVALYDKKRRTFTTAYRIDLEVGKNNNFLHNFPKEKSFSGYVIDTKKPLLSTNRTIKSLISKGVIEELGVKSKCWLGVPIIVDTEAIGVMVVQSYISKKAYTQDDVTLLELIAANISKTIKQSKDFEKINLLNQALIQTPSIVMITNTRGKLEYVNPSFTKITGYKPEEVLGKNTRFLSAGKKNNHIYRILRKTVTKGKHWQDEFDNLKKDGSKFRVSATISPVKNKEGEITHYIAVEEDITEKRKLERQFINAFIEAQEIEKQAFGEELHDGISQILSAEGMYIDLLIEQNQVHTNDKSKFLNKIRELNINAVNEARNISHGLMSYQLKRNGLIEAVKNICSDFNSTTNLTIDFTVNNVDENELSNEIKTNLFRVIQEITTNIVRHSSANKASIVLNKLNNGSLKLIVKDNGVGIDLDKIKSDKNGIGIKNLERRIIYLNGTINVNSKSNEGTHYTIEVPLLN